VSGDRVRILIVEDDDIIRGFLADSLEMKGYEPAYVADGAEALAYLETHTVDVVLSDVRMPEIGGIALTQKVRERFPGVPVVLITGVHREERERILAESGAAACLPKPLRIQHLCDVLEQATSGR
jgi:CheY-like chemotaxis protein